MSGPFFRDEFPLAADWAYLNHAGTGPVPLRHVRAVQDAVAAFANGPPPGSLAATEALTARVRQLAARLLHAETEEFAVLSSTVQGINLVPLALDWREGDEVVAHAREYPSVLLALERLQARGVRLVRLPDQSGRFTLVDLRAAITPRTRLVATSLVGFATGWRAPVADMAALCHPRGIWLVVDAIQAVGVLDVDAPALGADIVAAHGYKHMLAGYGVAPVWCSPRARSLTPPTPSRMGVQNHLDATRMIDAPTVWSPTARRFEAAVPSVTGLHGMVASLELLLEATPAAIEAHVNVLLDRAAAGLARRGWAVTSPRDAGERSSLLCAVPPSGIDIQYVVARMERARVVASVREGAIRISPHMYNDDSDIDRFLAAVG